MIQKHRIRTEIGKDQRLTVELKQDFDLLEILSLKFTQQDIYTSLCADYGVVCGRISVNDGFGISNARISIFIPLSDEDSDDPIISELYPYRSTSDTSDDGYKYNLLPSRKQHSGHTPTGTFPDQDDIISREEVLEVYEKYYKYTVKTNDAGDFMIWGVPVGTQIIHVDVDLSDMGCQSLIPYDFIYEGTSEEKFENNYTFMSSNNLSGLPQITTFEKTIEVYPFWGNQDLCEIGITRTDFDLGERGIRIEPYSIMMGGTFTDSGKDSVRVRCNVDNQMGEKCNLTTGEGDIEAIRFTGDYEKNGDGTLNYSRPVLETIQLDSQIDENGNFFFRVPMNMRYIITNDFGEQVVTTDSRKGIATRGTYRFRLSLENDNGAKKQYRGKYLIPQIKEHQLGTYPSNYADPKSYSFSTDIDDYPDNSIDDISGVNNGGFANDYFYSFRYNRVYTVSSFINQYYNKSWAEKTFSFFTKDRNESFIGIKEIQPSLEEDCANNNEYFPINDAVRNHKFKFLITIILNFLERIYLLTTQFALDVIVEFLFDASDALNFKILGGRPLGKLADRIAGYARDIQERTKRELGLINYPDCYECNTDGGEIITGTTGVGFEFITINSGDELDYITNNGLSPIQGSTTSSTHSFDPNNTYSDDTLILNIGGVATDKNYILEFINVAAVYGTDPDTGDSYLISNEEYGYVFVGHGSPYPILSINGTDASFQYLAGEIYENVLVANGLGSTPQPTNVVGTAINSSNQIVFTSVYFVSQLTETSVPIDTTESGCEKYDVIYDPDMWPSGGNGSMYLKATLNTQGTYQDLINNPNLFTSYPDIFLDGNEDPCTTSIPPANIVVSISAYTDETSGYTGKRDRRCAIKAGHEGTASGYSEFRDGVYTLIAAAGKNRPLISDYSRRKLLGKLMCGGVTSYTFSNSWLNGALYFFQFRRRRGGSNAKYCKDLIYRKEDNTGVHYYYRSTPYYNGNFIGVVGERSYGEILFPTTIMDLGPRNTFIKEICVDPELDVNCSVSKSIGSTSYQDLNDLMEYIIASKEVKEQGRLNVQDLFDRRGGGMIDGDIAQLLNFNSQVGIFGYDNEDSDSPYYTTGSTILDGVGPLGVDFVFSEDDEDTAIIEKDGTLLRLCINGAGNLTESAQEIPYYRWDKKGDGFGPNGSDSEKQNWYRNTIYSTKYQGGWTYSGLMETDPYGGAGGDPTDNINSHYYDGSILPPFRDCVNDNYSATTVPIGGPFFFYFGLRTGKSAWNKFIKNFGPL